jgi:subtilisin
MKKIFYLLFTALVLCLSGSRYLSPATAQISEASSADRTYKQQVIQSLVSNARQTGNARVIVGFEVNSANENITTESQSDKMKAAVAQTQNDFFNRYQSAALTNVKRFEYIPFLAFETDAATLDKIKDDPSVVSVEEDIIGRHALAESTLVVGANATWASGFTGSGQIVAILDSGVDRNHPFLNGKVISEACYSSTNASSTSVCPGGASESTAVNSGLHCPPATSGCAHGTHVAGTAAGSGQNFSGVARDANVIAIQIFSQFTSASSCGASTPCALYWTSDLIKGLERVRTLSASMNNIAAVNLSLQTNQQFTSNCDTAHAATKAAIDGLRSVGIATVVASGNAGFTNALTAPACISTAISVGSTDDGSLGTISNTVSSFTNSSPLLHLFAPGRWINSSVPNGAFQNYWGTSMASPHVAGALAILKQRKPNANVQQMLNALISSGQPITDSRNSVVKPRIRINEAVNAIARFGTLFDYDSDGKSDISVFRPSTGDWFILNSLNASFSATRFGASSDLLVPADYDGDARTDIAVFRPSDGTFYRLNSANNSFSATQFGMSGDLPVSADFDGDGRADVAIYRPSAGAWYRFNSSNGQFVGIQFGIAEDKPALGDYDGDGKADVSVFRPSSGSWYRLNSSNNQFVATQFGAAEDRIVPADYDGDGRSDLGVFRPSSGSWYLLRSTQGFAGLQFGAGEDLPTPNAFVR